MREAAVPVHPAKAPGVTGQLLDAEEGLCQKGVGRDFPPRTQHFSFQPQGGYVLMFLIHLYINLHK